ncbi:uncharacterized protein N7483_009079 [Penicillium malachiteum]|uniref:uncharacterized protein n=1 Tax=Penicillium malachiteum TaxID=1324776 RepID=UPI002547CA83|nr:uncharacterized protein N7483_009079 [Penicillium malachiteum]KAJ5721145.1 hypothetical protein N7483_009079 [Penicillium malachiteum]
MAATTDLSILDCEMSIKTVRLEKEYEKALSDSTHLLDMEKDRFRRMENLLLQFESDNLRSQLDQANQQLRGSAHATEIDKLLAQIAQLQSDLVRHTRVNQQYAQEMRQQKTEFESQRTVFETKIETLRKQLQSVKDKLQEAQHNLQQKRSTTKNHDGASTEPQSRTIPLQRPGLSSDHHSGLTIATPGAIKVQEKIKRQSALPGDKSAFSITPFLNRTGGSLDSLDSPELSDLDEKEVNQAMADSGSPLQPKISSHLVALSSSPTDQPRVAWGPGPVKGKKAKPKPREGNSASTEVADKPKKVIKKSTGKVPLKDADELQIQAPEQEQAKPKKRKLGAQRDHALFEDDEEDFLESRKPARKVGLGAGRSSGLPTAPILSTSAGDRNPRTLGFGGFSPLKRDRKR